MEVLISGIGIAGPALAYWLIRFGLQPTLVERAAHLRTGGYAIDFWGRGFDVADLMGIIPEIRRDGYQVKEMRIVNARGRRIGGFNVDVFRAATHDRYVTIPRSDLVRTLYRKVAGQCETIFGDTITHLVEHSTGVDVTFALAPSRRFDAVIGADGLHSVVRELAFGSGERFEKFLGYSVAAFEVAGYRPRDEDIYINYSAPGKQVGRLTLRNDRTLFLFVFADQVSGSVKPDDIAAHKRELHAQFDNLGWECNEILHAMESASEVYFDRVSQIRIPVWSRGRIGLVGDAAFCPSLLAGQGSALAMSGAYVLAGELARESRSPEVAFRRYEELLHPVLLAKQNAAEKFGRSFTPMTRRGLWLRNQVTKAFNLPLVARLLMGTSLLDRFELPDYTHLVKRRPPASLSSPGSLWPGYRARPG